MKKWEYLMVYYLQTIPSDMLNDIGANGWELVTIIPEVPNDGKPRWIFKREKVEELKPFDGD